MGRSDSTLRVQCETWLAQHEWTTTADAHNPENYETFERCLDLRILKLRLFLPSKKHALDSVEENRTKHTFRSSFDLLIFVAIACFLLVSKAIPIVPMLCFEVQRKKTPEDHQKQGLSTRAASAVESFLN